MTTLHSSTRLYAGDSIRTVLTNMADEMAAKIPDLSELILVGIQRKGVQVAACLKPLLEQTCHKAIAFGAIDVSMHRDDLDSRPAPEVQPTSIPSDITDRTILLVDDVLFSGRTARAALDALNDMGRPGCVKLAALVDRGHRQLPIEADFVGKKVATSPNDRIVLKSVDRPCHFEIFIERR